MDDTQNPETHITCGCPSKQQNQTSQPNKGEGDRGTVMHAFHGRTNLTKANHPTSASTPVPHRQAQPRESGRPGVVLLVETEMSGEQVIGASLDDQEEEVWWVVIVVPLVVSVVLFGSVVLYRCRAHRLRQDRIAQEREQELCEMKCTLIIPT